MKKIVIMIVAICLTIGFSNTAFANKKMHGNDLLLIAPIGVSALNGVLPIFGLWSYLQGDFAAGIAQTVLQASAIPLFVFIPIPILNVITFPILWIASWLVGVIAPYTYKKRRRKAFKNAMTTKENGIKRLISQSIHNNEPIKSSNPNYKQIIGIAFNVYSFRF